MQKHLMPVNSKVSKPIKKSLSIIHIIGIVSLGGYAGMMANRFTTQKSQDYNERATPVERQKFENEANSKNEHFKKANKKERAKQKTEVPPVVTAAPTITSAYNENIVADDLIMFKGSGSVSDTIASVIGYPYLTLHGGVDKFMWTHDH